MRTALLITSLALAPVVAWGAPNAQSPVVIDGQETRPAAAAKALVNLNTASLELLETLPGIGRRTAERIIEYRKKTPFTKIEQLMNVKGIGEKSFLRLKPLVNVSTAPGEKAQQQ